jgi:hypothetical protein
MSSTLATHSTPTLAKAINCYYKELHMSKGKAGYELAISTAFSTINTMIHC